MFESDGEDVEANMHPGLTEALAASRHAEMLDAAARSRRGLFGRRRERAQGPATRWASLTVRLATSADRAALERLAALDGAEPPQSPVLIGSMMAQPVAALSLADGIVIADPFTPTCDLVELLRLRARQLRGAV
jgi:hypothetical protein